MCPANHDDAVLVPGYLAIRCARETFPSTVVSHETVIDHLGPFEMSEDYFPASCDLRSLSVPLRGHNFLVYWMALWH